MTDAARTEQPDHIKAAAAEASLDEQIAEVKRELAMRRNAYPAFIKNKRITQEQADRQTARLLATLHTLMAEKAAPDLLAALRLAEEVLAEIEPEAGETTNDCDELCGDKHCDAVGCIRLKLIIARKAIAKATP